MPNYSVGSYVSLYPNQAVRLFDAETVSAGQASEAFRRMAAPGQDDAGTTFQILFASAATAVVDIQISNVDTDASFVSVNTSAFTGTTSLDAYTDIGRSLFYRARLVSQSGGGTLTVIAQR